MKNLRLKQFTYLFLISIFIFVGCGDNKFYNTATDCTDILEAVFINVIDSNGNPVTGAEFSVINKKNGNEFCKNEDGSVNELCAQYFGEQPHYEDGVYALVTTKNVRFNPPENVQHLDVIKATVQKNGATVTAEYLVDTGRSRCHPKSVEGPDPLVLSN